MGQEGRGRSEEGVSSPSLAPLSLYFPPVLQHGRAQAGWHLHSMNFKLAVLLSMQSKSARAVEMATAASRSLSPFQQDISLWFTAAHAPRDETTTTTVILYEGSERAE